MNVDLRKKWWVVPVLAGAVGLLALVLALAVPGRQGPLPGQVLAALLLLLGLVGLSFLWAFLRRDVWWAVAPGVGALASAVALLVNYVLPANNGWIAALIVGAGAFVIAAIPNRRVEVDVAHFVGIVLVLFGLILSPLRIGWKVLSIALALALALYFAWLDREDLRRLLAP
jgi:hypothetical protein